ncbi:FAD-dependent monooxygenase [Dictyobacter aurantiacus]|uniref:Oxygenase n=1 Tax=Dictyobacter aurantiacus TaxID=1936993 RepID=A0A401ZKV4_9CHLR|nr:FAD-dependent monooxygenase [Dictyobacter aurantiacus]GCE07476.1 oxygenase [Dictyobacter aurantiacus]
MAETTDVLVVGAGPTGLTMANLLQRGGVRVRIVDKKDGPTVESRALVVHARTLELLDRLGLAGKAVADGEPLTNAYALSQGKRFGRLAFVSDESVKSTPYPFGLIYGQDQMEHLLIQSLAEAGGRVEWNTELLGLEQTLDGVRVCVRAGDGNEETIEARWIIGADGAHSPVRHALSLGFAGRTYTMTLFIADLEMEWDLGPHQGGMDLEHSGFFFFVPMHGTGRFRLFGTLPPDLAARETLSVDDVRRVLDTRTHLQVNILKANWISVYRTHQRIARHFRVGRVFLVGDAAHIHSPAGGQGMNTGIGDAYNLAWKLALVVKGQSSEALLDSYDAERIPFARAILRGSDWAFQLMTATNPILRAIKLYVLPKAFRAVSWTPLFKRRVFWLLSQLWTSYRGSPAVAQLEASKHGPQAGDRAPYGFFEDGPEAGKSIFALFKNMDHHLFLFAGSRSEDIPGEIEEQLQTLLATYKVPIHLHRVSAANRSLHQLYGVDEPTLVLVRPDGHIAYRGRAQDLDGFRTYLDQWFKRRESQAPAREQTEAPVPSRTH